MTEKIDEATTEPLIRKGSFKGRYLGEEFLETDFKGSDPIINGLLWERDVAIILGREKSCKSLLAQYMALHLTAAHDFLGEFKIEEPCNVIYLQAEGKISQTQQNIKRMMRVIPADMRRFLMLYYPAIALDARNGFEEVYKQIKAWEPLKARNTVFIGDSLYMMMAGDMKDDEDSKRTIANIRILGEEFGLTYLILHHCHRDKIDPKNMEKLFEGDNSIFGSFVWKAFPDHILYIQKHEHKLKLTCNTQRTGDVAEEVNMVFSEPDPLFFSLQEFSKPSDDTVYNTVKLCGKLTPREIEVKTCLARGTVHNSLTRLFLAERLIRTQEGKTFIYHVKP